MKPIWRQRITPAEFLAAHREAQNTDDGDYIEVPLAREVCPISVDENALRAYIREQKITRKITSLTVHCTASHQRATVGAILNIWKRRGWRNPGYHILLPLEGFAVLHDFNLIANGAIGYNANGVHISYIGGVDHNIKPIDNRTESQKKLIGVFIEEFVRLYPDIKVIGHNEVARKACPCFKVKDEYPEYWTGI